MSELRFDGRVAIVTGGGRGVGSHHALLLAARGARVVVADFGGSLEGQGSSKQPADEVVAEIRATGGDAVACYASVADPEGAQLIVRTALRSFGRVDAVINNAGISDPGLFEDLPQDQFQRMIEVHYLGTVYVTRAAWDHMRSAGFGRIVNTCSEAMLGIHPMVSSYGGAKAGVFGLTRTLATEGPAYGILVNAIMPRAQTRLGNVETVMKVYHRGAEATEMVSGSLKSIPPNLVAPAAAFLAHESCRLNGEVLVVGGGLVQRLTVQLTQGIHSPELTPEFIAANSTKLLDPAGAQSVAVNADIRLGVSSGTVTGALNAGKYL